jgi:23S rRNA pseudouridine1911/1915/1917 synthase
MGPVSTSHTVAADEAGKTLAALLRALQPNQSWSQIKSLATGRRVAIGRSLCMDPARRLKEGEVIEVFDKPAPVIKGERPDDVVIRHLDDDVIVVEKASGISTVRHPAERSWDDKRRQLAPTLDDVTQQAIAKRLGKKKHELLRLRIVHRLDKETSGLVAFARNVRAERELGRQFKAHTVVRRYIAIVAGTVRPQTFSTWLVRDRGDGRRGSGSEGAGKHAVTHVDAIEQLPGYTVLVCQLETGRTHQIRIHLAESGHPVCGESVYNRRADGSVIEDASGAPRLALHAAELGFVHPGTGKEMAWTMPPPADLERFLERLRSIAKP